MAGSLTLRRIAWASLGAVLAAAALVAIVAIVRGEFGETEGRIMATLVVTLLCGAVAIASVAMLTRRLEPPLAWILLVGAGGEYLVLVVNIWRFQGDGDASPRWILTAFVWAIAGLLVSTLRLLLRTDWAVRTLFVAVLLVAAAGGAVATWLAWSEGEHDAGARLLAVLAILAVAGYLLAPILERVLARKHARSDARNA